jgi:hypothetical protein
MSWKTILISIVSALCAAGVAQTNRVAKATEHGRPADGFLLDWLARQYTNDMRTLQGRIKWHGKPVRQELDDTNRMCMVEYYADGTVHVDPYRKKENFHSLTNTALWKNASGAKRQKVIEMRRKAKALRAKIEAEKSVLPGLKAAQLQTFDNKNMESNVTVNINIGGGGHGR